MLQELNSEPGRSLLMTIESVRTRTPVLHTPGRYLGAAVVAGVGFDLLAMGRPHGPGLTLALTAITGTVLWAAHGEGRATRDAWIVGVGGMLFAFVPAWRDSTVLVTLAVLAWLALTASAVRLAGGPALAGWTIGSYVRSWAEVVQSLAEPFTMFPNDIAGRNDGAWLTKFARLLPIARGLGLGAIVVGFFALLLGSADPIFAQLLSETFDIDLSFDRIVRFGLVAGLVTWLTIGMARRAAKATSSGAAFRPEGHALTEARVISLGLNALFLGFVMVQVDYLFAGEVGRVEMGYAEYARRGFFELVTVAICVAGLILSIDWLVHRRDRFLDILHVALVVQTFVIMASALLRMKAYVDAYGLSELRFYTTVFMVWTALVLTTLLVTVLRSRRDRFALAAFVAALAAIAILVAVNPDARIAEINIERAGADVELDAQYLADLSNDAVPLVVATAPAGALDTVVAQWTERMDEDRANGWRSWSFADARARAALDGLD